MHFDIGHVSISSKLFSAVAPENRCKDLGHDHAKRKPFKVLLVSAEEVGAHAEFFCSDQGAWKGWTSAASCPCSSRDIRSAYLDLKPGQLLELFSQTPAIMVFGYYSNLNTSTRVLITTLSATVLRLNPEPVIAGGTCTGG